MPVIFEQVKLLCDMTGDTSLSISLYFTYRHFLTQSYMIKHNFLLLMIGLILIISIQPQYVTAQHDLLKIAESLQKSEGKVTIYYPIAIENKQKVYRHL